MPCCRRTSNCKYKIAQPESYGPIKITCCLNIYLYFMTFSGGSFGSGFPTSPGAWGGRADGRGEAIRHARFGITSGGINSLAATGRPGTSGSGTTGITTRASRCSRQNKRWDILNVCVFSPEVRINSSPFFSSSTNETICYNSSGCGKRRAHIQWSMGLPE